MVLSLAGYIVYISDENVVGCFDDDRKDVDSLGEVALIKKYYYNQGRSKGGLAAGLLPPPLSKTL